MRTTQNPMLLAYASLLLLLVSPAHAQWTYMGSTYSNLVNNSNPPLNGTPSATETPSMPGVVSKTVSLQVNATGNAGGKATNCSAEYNFHTKQMFQWQNAGQPTETVTVTETDTLSAAVSVSTPGFAEASAGGDSPDTNKVAFASVPPNGFDKPGPFNVSYPIKANPNGAFSFTLNSELDCDAEGSGGGSFTFTSQSNGSSTFSVQ